MCDVARVTWFVYKAVDERIYSMSSQPKLRIMTMIKVANKYKPIKRHTKVNPKHSTQSRTCKPSVPRRARNTSRPAMTPDSGRRYGRSGCCPKRKKSVLA